MVAHESGGGDNQPQTAIWSIKISFGEFSLELYENSSELKVTVHGNPFGDPDYHGYTRKIKIKPSTDSYVTEGFGERPYLLTFIPVWNGLLISHGVHCIIKDWGDTITCYPKDPSLNVNDQLSNILSGAQAQSQSQENAGIFPWPPQLILTRYNRGGRKRYQL